jgi:Co/Zn/Cd efflux system component
MSAHCCEHETPTASSIENMDRYRRILWIALIINAFMFLVEILAG